MIRTGKDVEDKAPGNCFWKGRRVRVVDGAAVTMADTPENQAEYPQPKSQRRGCGFPIARIVVVFSLAVGTVLDAAIGKYQGKQTGENSMFRSLHDVLAERDVRSVASDSSNGLSQAARDDVVSRSACGVAFRGTGLLESGTAGAASRGTGSAISCSPSG